MKVFKSLQEVRVQLQKMNLKKSGENKYAGFFYYELADFVPAINELCLKAGLLTKFNLENGTAKLTIYSIDDASSFVEFTAPFVVPTLKGGNEVQNLGAGITYLRRYLFLIAFEIVESDVSDATMGSDQIKPIEKTTNLTSSVQKEIKTSNTMPKKETNTTSETSVKLCHIGKNKGKFWDDMNTTQLKWYLDFMINKGKQSYQDSMAIQYLNKLIDARLLDDNKTDDLGGTDG
jgi:hypothetical protein